MKTLTLENVPQAIQVLDNRLDRIEEILKNQPSQEPDRMFTVPEVAEYLHLSVPTIYRLTSHREIPYQKIDGRGRIYFRKSGIDSWINKHSQKTISEMAEEVK